jgi:RNA polymerase sigma-70 factor (ECF subfamily)
MLLHDARRAARTDAAGALITLERQDRSLWDAGKISEGLSLLSKVLRSRGGAHRIGPYQVEAAIAAVHAEAEAFEVTDWAQMLELYDRLRELKPGIVTEVNRAVVLARVVGPDAALEALRPYQTDPEGRAYPPLLLALGDLYERSGELDLAHRYLEKAADRATNEAERLHILGRLRRLGR